MVTTCAAIESYKCGLYGDFGSAFNSAQTAMHAAENGGAGYARVMAASAMGTSYFQAGDYGRAAEMAHLALDIADREHTGGGSSPMVIATLAEAEIGLGQSSKARERTAEFIKFCHAGQLYWNLAPWFAHAHACMTLDDGETALNTLYEIQQLVDRTGSIIYQPFLHEHRAEFAGRFNTKWEPGAERDAALRLFAELGATGHVDRIANGRKTLL